MSTVELRDKLDGWERLEASEITFISSDGGGLHVVSLSLLSISGLFTIGDDVVLELEEDKNGLLSRDILPGIFLGLLSRELEEDLDDLLSRDIPKFHLEPELSQIFNPSSEDISKSESGLSTTGLLGLPNEPSGISSRERSTRLACIRRLFRSSVSNFSRDSFFLLRSSNNSFRVFLKASGTNPSTNFSMKSSRTLV